MVCECVRERERERSEKKRGNSKPDIISVGDHFDKVRDRESPLSYTSILRICNEMDT